MEADKDATIRDLQEQITAAGLSIDSPRGGMASLRAQASHRAQRDEQLAAALARTRAQAAQLEALCAHAERSSAEQVRLEGFASLCFQEQRDVQLLHVCSAMPRCR